jgi:predicted transport protein
MKDNQMCKPFNDDLYEILKLNASEPIVFQRDNKNQQTYTERTINQPGHGHWGNGDYVIILKEFKNMEHVLPLIKQSYEEN